MAASTKYITVPVSSDIASSPAWYGLVQHTRTLSKNETYAHLNEKLGFTAANIKAGFLGLKRYIQQNASRGGVTFLDGVASIRNFAKGPFSGSNGPWVPGKNLILVSAVELDPFKSTLAGVIPANSVAGVKPTITSVLDNATGIYDVIAGTDDFTIAGTELGPDADRADEYVAIIAKDGTLTKATVTSSSLQVVKAKFALAPAAGEYTLVVCTRSGYGEGTSLKSATRKITIA